MVWEVVAVVAVDQVTASTSMDRIVGVAAEDHVVATMLPLVERHEPGERVLEEDPIGDERHIRLEELLA